MEATDDGERVVLTGGKHVMLSYNWSSQAVVSQIYQLLKVDNIPVWFDIQGGMKQNIYDSMADGIENAAVVCCFMTSDYQNSENCKLELQYAKKRGKRIIPCMLGDKSWKPSSWLGLITGGEQYTNFRDVSTENIGLKTRQLIDRIKEQSSSTQPIDEPSYLFELIRLQYQQNNRIEQIINPAKSFPIEQSYVNLAIVEIKEQQENEKKLRTAQHDETIIGTFEQIYGKKTIVDIKDIFDKCKDQTKNVLVLGRAGIGKSTFCQYVAYRWATGAIWSQYDLLILFPLRSLTDTRYPPLPLGTNYSLIDLVKKEYFGHDLSEDDNRLLREQFSQSKVLWLLDGYDEIVQNVPGHLRYLFEQLLKTPHHIVTSRPYLNTLSYTVQLEITGFTDENIVEYVKQFYEQTSIEQKLINFLKLNSSIWGVAHIPINLELICSIWIDTNWSEAKTLTITALYDGITEWLCRRYLTKQNIDIQMTKEDVYTDCQKELVFLETLAFRAMENNTIILRKELLQKVLKDTEYSSKNYARLLSIGILKSINDQSVGNQIEVQKDHYFIHLSFQEHFAARYLTNALGGPGRQTAIDFIRTHKYNQRFQLVFIFTCGLLLQTDSESSIDTFWDLLLGESSDLVGLRHIQLIISCMDEAISSNSAFRRRTEITDVIANVIVIVVSMKHTIFYNQLMESLRRSVSLLNDFAIQEALIKLLANDENNTKKSALSLIAQVSISQPSTELIERLLGHLDDAQWHIRQIACEALEKMGGKAATDDVINKLLTTLGDENASVRMSACDALGKMGGKVSNDIIRNRLASALEDDNEYVRRKACEALGQIGEQAATDNVINSLMIALEDKSGEVRWRACHTLGKMGEKAVIDNIINKLILTLGDQHENVRRQVRDTLGKMREKTAINVLINRLLLALQDQNANNRKCACIALREMGEAVTTNEVINSLATTLADENEHVREEACKSLGRLGEKVLTDDLINKLVIALDDKNTNVRWHACQILKRMNEKAPTDKLIDGLLTVLRHEDWSIRQQACKALGEMSEKTASHDVIIGLVSALTDAYGNVQETACNVLGTLGEKVATSEVINGLIHALGNVWSDVRESAWKALGNMGENGVFQNVITKLLSALKDDDSNVRANACRALGQVGEKTSTDEVINGLLTALEDGNQYVRQTACEALGQMGEKAATHDVTTKLVAALKNENVNIKQRVCETFGQMAAKAASNDGVITGLTTASGDANWNVSMKACHALAKMGEKAHTDDVICALVTALENNMGHVRRAACEALGEIGQRAPTDKIINGLVTALWDRDTSVRESACQVLETFGERAASNEVINGLINARRGVFGYSRANQTLETIFLSFSALTQLSSDTVLNLFQNIKEGQLGALRGVPPDQFMKVFLQTKSSAWVPVVTISALLQGNAVIITGQTLTIYGRQEPVQVIIPDEELRQQLVDAFIHQKEEFQLSSELSTKSRVVCTLCLLM